MNALDERMGVRKKTQKKHSKNYAGRILDRIPNVKMVLYCVTNRVGVLDGGPSVALSNIRKQNVALSTLNEYVPCHYILSFYVAFH